MSVAFSHKNSPDQNIHQSNAWYFSSLHIYSCKSNFHNFFILARAVVQFDTVVQGLFLDILKKTQTQKNSKLKPNPEKTQGKSPKNSKSANSTREQMPESISSKLLRAYNLRNSSFFQ